MPALAEIGARWPGRLEVVAADALTVGPETLVAKADGAPLRICANLPYNVATPLLVGWLEAEPWPPFFDRLTLMFQREVALRIVATPAERADYGRLGVLAGWRTQARILFDVPAAAFTPPPKVTSSVVELIPRAAPDPCDPRRSVGLDPRRLRPAAQDAAPVAEGLRRRARPRPRRASRRGRARSDDAGGGGRRRRFRRAGARRRPKRQSLTEPSARDAWGQGRVRERRNLKRFGVAWNALESGFEIGPRVPGIVRYRTSTLRNCQGSLSSMSSGKRPGRSASGVQSV